MLWILNTNFKNARLITFVLCAVKFPQNSNSTRFHSIDYLLNPFRRFLYVVINARLVINATPETGTRDSYQSEAPILH